MPSPHARAALVTVVLAVNLVRPVLAQWSLSAGIDAPRFSGAAVEPATGRSLRPYRPTVWQLGVRRVNGRVGVGLRVHYASSSLALEGSEAVAAVKDALELYGIAPELSVRVARVGPDAALRVAAGPLLEAWKLADVDTHWRLGMAAGVELRFSLGGRWTATARAGGAVCPSPFASEDLDEALERRALWRREAGVSLEYRL